MSLTSDQVLDQAFSKRIDGFREELGALIDDINKEQDIGTLRAQLERASKYAWTIIVYEEAANLADTAITE